MKKRLFSLLMLAAATFGVASAQSEVVVVNNPDGSVEKTTYSFNPHWFMQLQGGAQYTHGEATFKNLISPAAQVSLGYQFTPVWALRLAVSGWQSKGGWEEAINYSVPGQFVGDAYQWISDVDGSYKWKYIAPALDVKFNLINAICGWKKNRVFSMNIIAGGGVNFAQKFEDISNTTVLPHYRDGNKIMPFGRFGLDLDFAVSKVVSINIEGMGHVLSDHYNGQHTKGPDWYVNVLAGVKIALGKTVNKTIDFTPAPAPVVVPEPEPEPEPVVEVIEPFKTNVFFKIRQTVAEPQEAAKIAELAAYMQKYPETKVTLSGYADKGTGNPRINLRLSEGRVNYVANTLRNEYNIDADRIFTEFKGDTVQPFAENDANRVTICITK